MPHSQIISILEWNSTEETKQEGIEALKKDFQKSGYSQNILNDIEKKLSTERAEEQQTKNYEEAMTFPVFFFDGLNEFKKIIHDSKANPQKVHPGISTPQCLCPGYKYSPEFISYDKTTLVISNPKCDRLLLYNILLSYHEGISVCLLWG